MTKTAPISESQRIESLDVLRGFALLGILLLNIIGFGFINSAYVAPSLTIQSPADMVAWILVDLAEGAIADSSRSSLVQAWCFFSAATVTVAAGYT